MVNLLIAVIVWCIVAGLLYWLVGMLPIPEPFRTVIKVCAVLICIFVLIGVLTGNVPFPALRL